MGIDQIHIDSEDLCGYGTFKVLEDSWILVIMSMNIQESV